MTSSGPFSNKALGWIIGLGLTSLVLGFVFSTFSEDFFGVTSYGTDAYSTSALGHKAFVELLRRSDVPVVVSKADSLGKSGWRVGLVLAEPLVENDEDENRLFDLATGTEPVLVVLPKRIGSPGPKRGWIGDFEPHPESEAEDVMNALGVYPIDVVRSGLSGSMIQWKRPGYSFDPDLEAPQLLASGDFTPLISCPTGTLLAVLPGGSIFVLSDPDLIATHGLGDGDNAALAVEIIEICLATGSGVIFDETIHGHGGADGLLRRLFRYPLVLCTAQCLIALCILLWAAMGRFGSPRPLPAHLEAGKRLLIANTAQLLRFSGHSGHAVREMYKSTIRELAVQLHAPSTLRRREIPEWLERVSRHRGVDIDLEQLSSQVNELGHRRWDNEQKVLRTAQRIHRWKKEILDAAGGDQRTQ